MPSLVQGPTGLRLRVGPKGQVLIPKPARDALHFHPGDELVASVVDGRFVMEKPDPKAFWDQLFALVPEKEPYRGPKYYKDLYDQERDEEWRRRGLL